MKQFVAFRPKIYSYLADGDYIDKETEGSV